MANTITANTGQIKSKAEELEQLNSNLKNQIGELISTENSLNTMWDGDANDAFHNAFQKDVTQMNNFYNAIVAYVTKLNEIASTYEKAESTNLNTANTRKY